MYVYVSKYFKNMHMNLKFALIGIATQADLKFECVYS